MPKGERFTEKDFNIIDRALEKGSTQKNISEKLGYGVKTISLVKQANGSYEKYKELRKAENDKRFIKVIEEPGSMEQDIHDMAREMRNIKSILLKIAEAWEVKVT